MSVQTFGKRWKGYSLPWDILNQEHTPEKKSRATPCLKTKCHAVLLKRNFNHTPAHSTTELRPLYRTARTILPDEDVEHRQDLAVVRHKRLPDEPLPVRPLVTGHERLEHLKDLDDHSLLSRVERG